MIPLLRGMASVELKTEVKYFSESFKLIICFSCSVKLFKDTLRGNRSVLQHKLLNLSISGARKCPFFSRAFSVSLHSRNVNLFQATLEINGVSGGDWSKGCLKLMSGKPTRL